MLPSPADVASILRTRTKPRVGGGADTGSFTEFTTPTYTQVAQLIERAGRQVYVVLGPYANLADETLRDAILDLITTRAAAEVERSYQQDPSNVSGSTRTLLDQYEADLKRLIEAVRESGESGGVVAGSGSLPMASGLEPVIAEAVWARPYDATRW